MRARAAAGVLIGLGARFRFSLLAVLLAGAVLPARTAGQAPPCDPLRRDLVDDFGMAVEAEPASINDARTGRMLAGCRITAAGGTSSTPAQTADLLYDQMTASGWARTPDPRDVPTQHILRLRRDGVDCLFGVYTSIAPESIVSDAQRRVNRAFVPTGQDELFNVIATCVPALEAGK